MQGVRTDEECHTLSDGQKQIAIAQGAAQAGKAAADATGGKLIQLKTVLGKFRCPVLIMTA